MCANYKYLNCQNARLRPLRGLRRDRFKMTFMWKEGTSRTSCANLYCSFFFFNQGRFVKTNCSEGFLVSFTSRNNVSGHFCHSVEHVKMSGREDQTADSRFDSPPDFYLPVWPDFFLNTYVSVAAKNTWHTFDDRKVIKDSLFTLFRKMETTQFPHCA